MRTIKKRTHSSKCIHWLWISLVTIVIAFVSPAYAQLPPLSCGTDSIKHDWDTNLWPAGSLSQSYTTEGETIAATITGDTGFFLPDTSSAPVTADFDTGGLSPAELSLELYLDFDFLSQSITVTFNVGELGIGVEELQFSIFDVDANTTQYQDEVTITGSLNGNPVSPALFGSTANTVTGNVTTGQTNAAETTSDGNLGVNFGSPVDQFIIQYTNGPLAPDPPGGQAISIHDILTCPRLLPNITASKTVSTYDPSNEGLYNIPGSEVVYTLSVSNSGDAATDSNSIFLKDSLPPELVFFNGDFNGAAAGIDPIDFTKTNAPSLSFDYMTDLKFSDATSPPVSFSDCNYTPASGYDPQIKHVCFNPKGQFDYGDPEPNFSIQFRTLIK
jgi:uncharacterized repeat protein (TIGR01451 family)